MTKMDRIYEWVDTELMRAIADWQVKQTRNLYGMYYLYGKQGSLVATEECPAGYSIVSQERISPAWSRQWAFNILKPHVNRFPCLPADLL